MLKFLRSRERKVREKFSFDSAPHIDTWVKKLIRDYSLDYIAADQVFCVESAGSRSRAYARIWGLPRIWQKTLNTSPSYILEVTHRFLKLNNDQQGKVLLHELAHIPKNFSGALVGHNGIDKRMREMENKLKKI